VSLAGQSGVSTSPVSPAYGTTFWVQDQTAPTAAAGTVVHLNDTRATADTWNMAAAEILPAAP
jgi:hypothetical protein